MTVTVPFENLTRQEAKQRLDAASQELFSFQGPVELKDQTKSWEGDTMSFSLKATYGWISVPIAGTVSVDENAVTVESALPGAVQQFLGEEKVKLGIEKKLRAILG